MKLHHLFQPFPIIASIRSEAELDAAIEKNVRFAFLVRSSIQEIDAYVKKANEHELELFIYFDMVRGLSQDKEAVRHLLTLVPSIKGIVSNKAHIVKEAKAQKVYAIFTLFLLDSYGLKQGMHIIQDIQPDGINIAPGLLPKAIHQITEDIDIPIIASGLIYDEEDIDVLIDAGVTAVSTSKQALWK